MEIPNFASFREIRFGEPLNISPGNEIAIPFLSKKGFTRSLAWHHGIYADNGMVIHRIHRSVQKVSFADFMEINDIHHSVYLVEYPDDLLLELK